MTDALSDANRPSDTVATVQDGTCRGRIDRERRGHNWQCSVCQVSSSPKHDTIEEAARAFSRHAREEHRPGSGPAPRTPQITYLAENAEAPKPEVASPPLSGDEAQQREVAAYARGVSPVSLALDDE